MNTLMMVSNLLVLPFWVLMIGLPDWQWTRRIIASPLILLPPLILYTVLIAPHFGPVVGVVLNPQIEAFAALIGVPSGALIVWQHLLAADLCFGRLAYLESRQRGINGWLMRLILCMTFLFGPLGLLLYQIVRLIPGLSGQPGRQPAS